ncbi:L-ascorbate metabolism protein UlaG, beta-lactamase superfamily [Chitinophaga sp. CF118]|uniref:MBL fold metallo-hydrolase n=1 Tax=Chitinophaga sp. CF118 TaxID=1884367 RepID=UPI0008F10FDB|nr:MBL fold metallo-hydrolase [Chitinophaga sp. CF118]SFF06024.1 L-ascorbate metabolism protein UlaG, beta-lactamase superfamily [Chitinophaga sp. CF118]
MKVQRLGWAGVKVTTGDLCILIDPVENFANIKTFVLDIPDADYRFSHLGQADYILLTHLHTDHYDAGLIRRILKPGGKLISSVMVANKLLEDGFDNVLALETDQTYNAGAASFTPVFAMDGIGDKQVSWVVSDAEHRILHGGDTIWHNQFWSIGEKFSPFDVVFLPVNGAVMHFKKPFSPVPATLTPLQAVAAANILSAGVLVPIHYGFTKTGVYEEFPNVVGVLQSNAEQLNVPLKLLQAGEGLDLN